MNRVKEKSDKSNYLLEQSDLQTRAITRLRRDLAEYLPILEDPKLIEFMLNPSGDVFIERFGEPIIFHSKMSNARAETIMKTIAGFHNKEITKQSPILECEFPLDGSRFAGCMPPITSTPSFSLRKKASMVFSLNDYISTNVMTEAQADVIRACVGKHKNILVIGGTGSGKTTLVNAIIKEISDQLPDERLVILEDTGEIQCCSKNNFLLHTSIEIGLTLLLKVSLRLRPDRILVGEVRGAEALDLLDAWNTGHEGGVATVHANNAESALTRLKSLISRNSAAPKAIEPLIAEAVHYIIHISKTKGGRRITGLLEVQGYENGQYITQDL